MILAKGVIKVVMTAASSDGPVMAKHHTTKQQRRALSDRMKDDEDEIETGDCQGYVAHRF